MPGPGAHNKQREAGKSHCWEVCSCPAQSRLRRAWAQDRLLLEGVTLWVLTLLMTSCVIWDQQPNLSEPQSSRPNVGATPTVFFSVMSATKETRCSVNCTVFRKLRHVGYYYSAQ